MDKGVAHKGPPKQHEPAVRHVGFAVEGVPPSPATTAAVLGSAEPVVGSPSPAIVPLGSLMKADSPLAERLLEDERRRSFTAVNRTASGLSSGFRQGSGLGLSLDPLREERPATPSTGASRLTEAVAPVLAELTTGRFPEPGPARTTSDPSLIAAEAALPAPVPVTKLPESRLLDRNQSAQAAAVADAAASVASSLSNTSNLPVQAKDQADSSANENNDAVRKDKPKLTRKERREIQEQQRAAKAAQKQGAPAAAKSGAPPAGPPPPAGRSSSGRQTPQGGASGKQHSSSGDVSRGGPAAGGSGKQGSGGADGVRSGGNAGAQARGLKVAAKDAQPPPSSVSTTKSVELFSHLPPYRRITVQDLVGRADVAHIHPAVLALGLKYADGSIRGADARVVALMEALQEMVKDYVTPRDKTMQRDLMNSLNLHVDYLVRCRPLSVTMGNAIRLVKHTINKLHHHQPPLTDEEARHFIAEKLQDYVKDKVLGCCNVLVAKAQEKVGEGDVILTYSMSSVVYKILLAAKKAGRCFRVVVVDSRPMLDGAQMLRRLLAAGISCDYVYICALSYIMKEASKVLLGAAGVLSNGNVMSRVGSAAVALAASAAQVPVLICAETHKFHERVQLDSITVNELGDPEQLVTVAGRDDVTGLKGWEEVDKLGVLNLLYDVMPCEYIDVIFTEFGALPPSSVPVILREYREDPFHFT